MIGIRIFAALVTCVVASAPLLFAQDLSRYREFEGGMRLEAVAQQAGVTSEARVIHRRPELIQELVWLPPTAGSRQGDSVRKVAFSFYNGQLFRMVIDYDRARTEGLTAGDMVEALSATYGVATLPLTEIVPSLPPVSRATDKVLASWEGPQSSITLFRSSYLSTFGLVVLSKELSAQASVAIAEAGLMDKDEAPQLEIERQQKLNEDTRVREERARAVNKVSFRP